MYYFVAFSTAFLAPVLLSPKAVRDAVGGLAGSFKYAPLSLPRRNLLMSVFFRRATLSLLTIAFVCWTIKNYTSVPSSFLPNTPPDPNE